MMLTLSTYKMRGLTMLRYQPTIGWKMLCFVHFVRVLSLPPYHKFQCSCSRLDHIFNYMHPQAILIDGSIDEETFFIRGAQQHANVKKTTLIELPRKAAKRLAWLAKLDSQALHSKTARLSANIRHY